MALDLTSRLSWRWTAVAVLVVLGVGLGRGGDAHAQQGPALVQVDEVRTEPLMQTMPVLGRIVTRRQGPVAARVQGLVDAVAVEVGDRVEAGEPLVWLDGEPLSFERDLAQAEYESALSQQQTEQEQKELLEAELARMTRLEGSAAFSKAQMVDKQNEIEVADSRLATAAARIAQYRARLSSRARDLEDAVIRAPYAGVVSLRNVSPGAFIRVGDPVITLIDDQQLEIEAEVPSDRLLGLTTGSRVRFALDDGTVHAAMVRAVVPEENPLTRTRAVRFVPTFGEVRKPLAVAQSVTVELPIGGARDVVTVAKDGVIQKPTGAIVFMVEDATAAIRPVQLGESVGGRFEVLGGLQPGDLVVIRGNERLQPGQAVTYPGAPPPENGKAPASES